MRATSQLTAAVCERCGAAAHHAPLVIDAAHEPRSLITMRPGESTCGACQATADVDVWQVVVNLTPDYPFPCVVIADGLRGEVFDRERLRHNAAVATEEWSELFDAPHEWNFMLVDRSDWDGLLKAIVDKTFGWERSEDWGAYHPSIQYELTRALHSFGAEYRLTSFTQLATNGESDALLGAVYELAEWLTYPSVIQSVRLSLRPKHLLFGPESFPALLDQLLVALGDGLDPAAAFKSFQEGAAHVGGSPERGVELLSDLTADSFDRALVSGEVLRFLAFVGASSEAVIDYWARKTDLEVQLRQEGSRSSALALRAAGMWVAAARDSGDPGLIAEALAQRATVQMMEIDDTTPESELVDCEAGFEESVELVPINLASWADRVRLGNLLNVRGLRIGHLAAPDYRVLLEELSRLIKTESDVRNRSYNYMRRGSFGLNAALLEPPQARLSDVIDDLDRAAEYGRELDDRPLLLSTLLDLARAHIAVAQSLPASSRESACSRGLEALDEFFATNPRPLLRSQAKILHARLLMLSGRFDDAASELEAALVQCPPERHDLRRDLAMRLGEALMSTEEWSRAAAALATACSEPDNSPTLSDHLSRGDLDTWRPDRAARWASYSYAMAGDGELAVEFIEAALARDASIAAAAGEAPVGPPVWAVRVSATRIARHASRSLPIVYINPHPSGTVALVLSGPGEVEVRTSTEVTGATFAQWMWGDLETANRSRPGVRMVDDMPLISKVLARALPLVGDGLVHGIALALKKLGAERVILVCGGYARSFPVHAAPYDHDGRAECLADWLDVAYAPSITLLDAVRALPRSDQFVGLADPVIDDLPPLEGARIEVLTAAIHFAPGSRRDFYGQDASSAVLTSEASDGCVVHLALHTRGFEADFALQDGDLSVLEFPQRLGGIPRLTFAASCRSASERQDGNVDEARQLGTAMLAAGCPATVVALWPVDDVATTLLVSKFYQHYLHDKLSPETSLRLAGNWLRTLTRLDAARAWGALAENADHRVGHNRGWVNEATRVIRVANEKRLHPYSDPCYWAPFQVFGVEHGPDGRGRDQ